MLYFTTFEGFENQERASHTLAKKNTRATPLQKHSVRLACGSVLLWMWFLGPVVIWSRGPLVLLNAVSRSI